MKSKALREVQTDPIAPAVRKRILADLNTRYSAVLLAFAWRICDKPNAVTAKAAEIDNSGLVLTVEDSKGKQGIARVMFDEPLTAANAEQQFTVLHQRALAPFLPSGPSPILALLGLLSLVLVAFPELSPPLEPFQKVNGLILEYVLSAGIPFVTSLSDLQRIFFIAVGKVHLHPNVVNVYKRVG